MTSNIKPIIFKHNYKFAHVKDSFLNKFPHPSQPNIIKVQILDEKNIDGIKHTERRIFVKNAAPWIFRKLLRTEVIEMRDSLRYDDMNQILYIKGWNETFSSFIIAREESKFYPDPNDPKHKTEFYQEGGITVGRIFGPLRGKLSEYTSKRMRREGIHACELLEQICGERFKKIIQHI